MARTGAAMVMFEVVGSFQAANMLKDARAQMNILNAIVLNGLGGVFDATVDAAKQIASLADATIPVATNIAQARIQFEKFMGVTDDLEDVTKEIIKIGTQFGFTADKSLEAGAKMAQLKGIVGGSSSVGAATEVGIKFALIGDMETQEAMQRLINLQQQTSFMFGDMTKAQIEAMDAESRAMLVHENSMKVLTQLNTVENNSAATMQQLTFIMNQFAAQADMTGESIADMAANAAVLVEAGEEMGKAGRALRMIYARLGADTNANNAALINAGVAVKDQEGNLRSLSDIVADLSKSFHTLTLEEQMNIAQLVAGNDHYVRFLKLVQNSQRQQQLATMANLGLADAQEEVNIKLQDQSTQLKKAEAELENAKGALGDGLIPMQIEATKQQTHFNRALNTFYTMSGTKGENAFGFAIRGLMDMSFHFERVHKVMGPVIEAMLNLKSLSVAMQTQQTIMRSLQGEQLMNPKFYQRVLDHQSNITQETMKEHQVRLRMQGAKASALEISRMESQLESQQVGLTLERLKIASLMAQEGVALNAVENERFQIYNQMANAEQRLIDAREQSLSQAQQNLAFIHAEAAMKTQLSEQDLRTLQTAIPLERQKLMNSFMVLENAENQAAVSRASTNTDRMMLEINEENLKIFQQMSMIKGHTVEDQERILAMMGQEVEIRESLFNQAVAELSIIQTKQDIEAASPAYTSMVQRVAQSKLMNIEMMTELELQRHLNDLDEEEINILSNLIPNAARKNMLEEEEITILQQLLPLMKEMNITNQQDAAILYDSVVANQVHSDSMKATGITASHTQQQMMKYSAAIGGASMLVGMFDNSTRGAKISMMLMTPVMLASTFQMVAMTGAMMKTTQAKMIDTSATIANTAATTGMNAAMKRATASALAFAATTGGMLLIVGSLVAGLYALTNNAEDAADSVIRMNGALGNSLEILTSLDGAKVEEGLKDVPLAVQQAADRAGIDLTDILGMNREDLSVLMQITKEEIEKLAIAADDGSSVIEVAYQKQLEAAESFNAALSAQNVLLQANAVLAGDTAAAQQMAQTSALENAVGASEQFGDMFNAQFESIGRFGGGSSRFKNESRKSADEVVAAYITAYESAIGREVSKKETEDIMEHLLQSGQHLSLYDEMVMERGLTEKERDALAELQEEIGLTGTTLLALQKSFSDYGDVSSDNVEAVRKAMAKLNFEMTTDQAEIIANTFGTISSAADDTANQIDGIGGALAGANEELFEFNNNREAMFFGFSKAGVTGDFVKQVQQKGVENLIANTELIVNNTFNGMSLPEMVNQVTDGVIEQLTNMGVVQEGAVEAA